MPQKLGRVTTLIHPHTKVPIETPILIPSFSSKGFKVGEKGASEIKKIFETASQFLTNSFLVSAYDVHHNLIQPPADFPTVGLVVLDSGGYEISFDRDLSDVKNGQPGRSPWNATLYKKVLKSWPETMVSLLVSYDDPKDRKPFFDQVEAAVELFRGCAGHLRTLLIKPETLDQYTTETALNNARTRRGFDALRSFDVIGLTEKELGGSMLDRMVAIARFRDTLDENNVKAPIHIFGALDPLSSCLYYVAGAEIFDGLTWIRYAYRDGICVYIDNAAAVNWDITLSHNQIRGRTMVDNLLAIDLLTDRLREFHHHQDFNKLAQHRDLVLRSIDSLNTKLKRGGA
jgi:hypothetical protein